ncbi:AAA family ATPase [Streptomyces mirabilis]|uniref:AAA family ATPase n=1 Tax=Streptomyces mirabilis TaxID=68239 RepID=UPI0036E448FF
MAQLVGRTSELTRLGAVIHGLGQPGAPTAVDIAGEPGIGKSRLLGEVCARARQAGFTVLRGRATEYEQHIPFQAFTDAFADATPGTPTDHAVLAEADAVLHGVWNTRGGTTGGAPSLRRELSRRPGPPPGQAVSLGLALGMTALLTASYPEVRADVARALAVARFHGDPVEEAAALALASLGEAYEGETEAAARFADAARGLTDALTDPDLTDLSEALVWLAWAETLIERYADAERHLARGLEIARRGGQLHVLPHLLSSRAFVYLNTCRLPAALESAEEAEAIARTLGSSDLLAFTLAFKTLILLLIRPLGDGDARPARRPSRPRAAARAGGRLWPGACSATRRSSAVIRTGPSRPSRPPAEAVNCHSSNRRSARGNWTRSSTRPWPPVTSTRPDAGPRRPDVRRTAWASAGSARPHSGPGPRWPSTAATRKKPSASWTRPRRSTPVAD